MIDVDVPRSPGWWLKTLARQLHDRRTGAGWSRTSQSRRGARPGLDLLDDYYRGDPPLPKVAEGWRKGFIEYLRLSRMNYAELVIEPTRMRMVPTGWRTAAAGDEQGDQVAHRIARMNEFDLMCGDLFAGMLTLGDAYTIVGAPDPVTGIPLVTAEDAREVITAHNPATGRTLAALKMFRDEWDSTDFAYLYLPGGVGVATHRAAASAMAAPTFRFSPRTWDWDDDRSARFPPGFEDLLPVHRLRNRLGLGDFETHLDVLDRINDTILDRVVIAKIQAFRQRAIKNLPTTDEHGNEIDYEGVFEADPGALWQVPEGVDFWESAPIDLGPVRLAIKDDVEALSAVTATPLHLVTPDAAKGSAEGASLMREGHLFKVEDRRRRADAGLARTMSTAFRVMGDTARADWSQIRTMWRPAERFSLSEMFDAASKASAAKLPAPAIWTDVLQYGPDDVPRLEALRAAELLFVEPQPGEPQRGLPALT